MSNAIPGHGVSVDVELDPSGSQGVFTGLGELVGDTNIERTRSTSEVTPHNESVSSFIRNILTVGEFNIDVNYIYGNSVHDGMQDLFEANTTFGLRFTGPSSGAGPGVDEFIFSGGLTSYTLNHPAREGERSANIMYQPSGPYWRDGTLVGA